MHSPLATSDWMFVSFSHVQKSKDRVAIFGALRCLADIFAALNDEETALNLYHSALKGATMKDVAAIDQRLAQLFQDTPENPVDPGEAQNGGIVSGTSAPDHTSKQDPDTAETMGQIEKLNPFAALH
ncbi:hypothetical protein FB451DRAFT_1185564 [Mycena latifolia]|nr:hypothetical protein FB451DRAFT_1185564 [Mycena latifolia]